MSRLPRNALRLSFLPFLTELLSKDKVEGTTKTEENVLNNTELAPETGWDRLKRMFSVNEFGEITPDLHCILQTGWMSVFIGGLYGGTLQGRIAYEQFIKSNESSKFYSHFEAKHKLQDAVTLGFGKGFYRWGWRLGLFCTTFMGVCTTIQVYKGEYGIAEYICAGALTGTMYKFNMGPRGWIVGGGLGAALGTVCGGITLGILKFSGLSMEEVRFWQYKWKDARNQEIRKGLAKMAEKNENIKEFVIHNEIVGDAGKSLDNLDREPVKSPNAT